MFYESEPPAISCVTSVDANNSFCYPYEGSVAAGRASGAWPRSVEGPMLKSSVFRVLAASVPLLVVTACNQSAETPVSPSTSPSTSSTAAADGSTLKVSAPALLSPAKDSTADSLRPTLSWAAVSGRYTGATPTYEVALLKDGATVYSAQSIGTVHQIPTDLTFGAAYSWRVRATQDSSPGPWSATWGFTAPNVPPRLGFPPPPECAAQGNQPTNRLACVIAVSALSPEWARCRAADKPGCFRFVRHVALALAAGDERWGMISKNPGDTQCTMTVCGPLGGEGYGEDIVAYLPTHNDTNRWLGFDILGAAGSVNVTLQWNPVTTIRAGNRWAPVPF